MIDFFCDINWELIIASIAIGISIITLLFQRKHNKLTFKPIPVLVKYNYIDTLRVRIWNNGNGPLIIKSIIAEKDNIKKSNLKDFIPPLPNGIYYVDFITDFDNRAIAPGESLRMIEFKNKGKNYKEWFDNIKKILNGITITMQYENIYGEKSSITFKTLEFGNTIDDNKSSKKKN